VIKIKEPEWTRPEATVETRMFPLCGSALKHHQRAFVQPTPNTFQQQTSINFVLVSFSKSRTADPSQNSMTKTRSLTSQEVYLEMIT
jgi:hypothetical protein